MQERSGIAETQSSAQIFKSNAAESKNSNELQTENHYISKELQQIEPLIGDRKSQNSINICVISGESEIKHFQISDADSEFGGFGSETNSSEPISGKQNGLKKHLPNILKRIEVRRLNMKKCEVQQREQSSLKSNYGSESMEIDIELNPVAVKQRNRVNGKELDDLVENRVDEIVEICSKSTTSSEAYRRQKINSNHQLRFRLSQQSIHKNKYSTETTSDFPVSSPSNPRNRTILQKNTLSGDIYERNLALLTTQKPQMTLDEKINAWKCDIDFSEVEDVDSFDDLFREHEELQQRVKQGKKNMNGGHYDFNVFRNEILPRIATATTSKEKAEKTTTSGVVPPAAERRMRAALEFECKIRQKQNLLRGRNTAPTFTSSSENELIFSLTSEQKCNTVPQKLRPRSSERGNQVLNGKSSCNILATKEVVSRHSQITIGGCPSMVTCGTRPPADEKSVFELHRFNREIDKFSGKNETNSRGLIEMRLDFAIQNKSQKLTERKSQLFKAPTLPRKSLPFPAASQLLASHSTALMSKNKNSFNPINTEKNTEYPLNQTDDRVLQTQIMSSSPHDADQSYSTLSPASKTVISASTCHQQQEFCNYLGLTGMSTANAVANAVAELAKCNLTRRSLRVRRLKQQEKCEFNQKIMNSKDIGLGDESIQITVCEGLNSAKIVDKEKISNLAETPADLCDKEPQSPANQKTSFILAEECRKYMNEQEMKIVCTETCEVHKKTLKDDTAHKHKTLFRHLKHQKPTNSNGTSTCPRSSISDVIYDYEINTNPTPNEPQRNSNILGTEYGPSPTQNSSCSSFKHTFNSNSVEHQNCIKRQLHNKFKKYLEASRKVKPSIYIVDTLHNPDPRQCLQHENNHMANERPETASAAIKLSNTQFSNHMGTSDKNMKTNDIELLNSQKQEFPVPLKQKKKDRLRKLLAVATPWHKIKNHRQLRSRKLLLVKRIKTATNKIETSAKESVNIEKPECVMPKFQDDTPQTTSSKLCKGKNKDCKKKCKRLHKGRLTYKSTPSPADTSTESPELKIIGISSRRHKAQTTTTVRRQRRSKSLAMLSSADLTAADSTNINPQICSLDNETVVVSSTTNSYDEATLLKLNKLDSTSQTTHELKSVQNDIYYAIKTKDSSTQSVMPMGIHFLSAPSRQLNNPVKTVNGAVDYIYYEMDVLVVVQEKTISFWKSFKIINVLAGSQNCEEYSHRISNGGVYQPPFVSAADDASPQWLPLGECRRLSTDMEISTSYANRICIHNSIPIYVEMRCREIPHERRNCNLLSMYINIYFFNDEDVVAKMHSIQLDAIQGLPADVVYTTITDSRYFVMSWPQQNILGKPRSGLCKYSLTPNLDTLASIRDFKHIRHCVRYLECSTDDKLLGFGDTQLTIWDHRSGDVLMNYDFNMTLGQTLGSIYYPSLEIGQNSVLLLFQYKKSLSEREADATEIIFIACSVSPTTPSHRVLRRLKTPTVAFDALENAINTGDYIVITAKNDEEIWINSSDATTITRVPPQNTRRFYVRGRSQIIELTSKSLTVDSFSNHVLKLASNPAVIPLEVKSNKQE